MKVDTLYLCTCHIVSSTLIVSKKMNVHESSTLKYDDVVSVILSEETHRKSSCGSTSGSALNSQRRGRMTKRGSNSGNHGKSRGKSKGMRS